MIGIYYNPEVASTTQRMMYASTSPHVFSAADIAGKVNISSFQIFDLVIAEELTDDWLVKEIETSKTRP